MLHVGVAGWSLRRDLIEWFGGPGTALERYARVLNAVEINSTFYRVHRPETFSRWAASVGPTFKFSVKAPKSITHEKRLVGVDGLVGDFLARAEKLGAALGPILVQLPPSLPFDATAFGRALECLQGEGTFAVVCEPRHASWFSADVDRWLAERHVARVAADPARLPGAGDPGGWRGLSYYRLHGSPRIYYSNYGATVLNSLAARCLNDEADDVWCIFDNTALGAAALNAIEFTERAGSRMNTAVRRSRRGN